VPWNSSYLTLPEWRALATVDASAADIVIVAASRVDELPAGVGDWVELCLAAHHHWDAGGIGGRSGG